MLPTPGPEQPAFPALAYSDELREFFTSRGIHCGVPGALTAFHKALQDPGFADEMGSVVRSIYYRESERLRSRGLADMLLEVLQPQAQTDSAPDAAAEEEVYNFVVSALRPGGDASASESDDLPAPTALEDFFGPTKFAGTLATQAPVDHQPPPWPQPPQAEIAPPFARQDLESAAPLGPMLTNDRLSAAISQLTYGEATDHEGPTQIVTSRIAAEDRNQPVPKVVPRISAERRISLLTSASWGERLRQAYWLPGLAVLAAAFFGWFFLVHGHSFAPPSGQASSLLDPAAATESTNSPGESAQTARKQSATKALPTPDSSIDRAESDSTRKPSTTSASGRNLHRTEIGPPRSRAKALPPTPLTPAGSTDPREAVFLASSGIMASHLAYAPAPSYPALAKLTHLEGQVIAQVVVSREGTVEVTHILSGPYLLRGSVEHAIRHWRYRPYVVDGRASDVTTVVTVNFRLKH